MYSWTILPNTFQHPSNFAPASQAVRQRRTRNHGKDAPPPPPLPLSPPPPHLQIRITSSRRASTADNSLCPWQRLREQSARRCSACCFCGNLQASKHRPRSNRAGASAARKVAGGRGGGGGGGNVNICRRKGLQERSGARPSGEKSGLRDLKRLQLGEEFLPPAGQPCR